MENKIASQEISKNNELMTKVKLGLLIILVIFIGEIILEFTNLCGWPAFMVMVFYFLSHTDRSKIKEIIIGGFAGIMISALLVLYLEALAPSFGAFIPKIIFIGIFVFSIVLFNKYVPWILNDYTFMFFLVSSTVLGLTGELNDVLIWGSTQLIGGTLLILGIEGVKKLVD